MKGREALHINVSDKPEFENVEVLSNSHEIR
ncbi:hypothetical protein YN1HA_19090 [Sulfurisphaera ohwakuensis]